MFVMLPNKAETAVYSCLKFPRRFAYGCAHADILRRVYIRLHAIILVTLTLVSVILSLWRETDTFI